jgi:tRNA (guanine-N7-)-methyltransferase
LDDAPGRIGVTEAELPALPDAVLSDRLAGRLDPTAWFTEPTRPFEIEIGTGKGAFLVNQAADDPGTNYLGIEWEGEIYAYCADRLRRRGLTNVRMLHANAADFIKWRVPDGIVRTIHLYFSDPWPKKKHHKNRVIQDGFLAEAHRVLCSGGELRVVTDHDELWAWDCEHFDRWCGQGVSGMRFERLAFARPLWAEDGELLGTNYERKFQREDRPAHSCTLRKA